MNARIFAGLCAALVLTAARGAENFDDALKRAALDYTERLHQAGDELNRTRERITREKAPLLEELRAAEGRISALERETSRLASDQEQAAANKRRLLQALGETRKTGAYVTTLANDGLKAAGEDQLPPENLLVGDRVREL